MNNFSKNLALWVIIGLLLIALFNLFQSPSTRGTSSNLAFSDFLTEVEGHAPGLHPMVAARRAQQAKTRKA